jgi:tetratricopeptide (TPR) repeat protein
MTKNRYIAIGLFSFFITLLFLLYSFTSNTLLVRAFPELGNNIFLITLIAYPVILLIGTFVLHRAIKLLKAIDSPWSKAFFIIALWGLIYSMSIEIQHVLSLSGILSAMLSILVLIIYIGIVSVVYDFSVIKSFFAIIITFGLLLAVIVLVGITTSGLSTAVETKQQKGTISITQSIPILATEDYQQGLSDEVQKNYSQALDDYNKALAAVPDIDTATTEFIANIYFHQAAVQKDSGAIADAIAAVTKGIALDPSIKAAYTNRAGYYLAQSDAKDALPDLSKALQSICK